MVDDINTQTEKVLKPIQLYDASSPHPLTDERNYQFLQELFDKKEIDPIANYAYNVQDVVQSEEDWLSAKGVHIPNLKSFDKPISDVYDQIYEHIIKISPRLKEKNKAIYMSEPWNTPGGVITVLHEFRHKAFDDNPTLKKVIQKKREVIFENYGKVIGGKYEEILNRFMDIKYHDDEGAKEYLRTNFNVNLYDKNEDFQHGIYKDIEQIEDILRLQQEDK
tara:strand:+ start:34 stop:696 length:663 start_codon:yes stop_codon:yes gene_type:complete